MHKRYGDVALLYRRMNVFGLPAANAVNEVCVMIARSFSGRPRFTLVCNPSLVRIVSIGGEITVRAIKNVPDGVGLGVLGPESSDWLVIWVACRLLPRGDIESRRRDAA